MLLALLVVLVWGLNFVVIHVGLDSFPPLLFAALRFAVMAPIGLLILRRGPGVPWRWVIAIGLFLSAGQFGLLFVSMDRGLPAGLASLVLQVQVLFTLAIAIAVLGERPTRRQLAGAAVAITGLVIIAGGRAQGVPLDALLLCVAAGASWGIGNICTRVARPPDPIALVMWSALVPPVPLAALALVVDGPGAVGDALAGARAGGVLALAYVIVASTVFVDLAARAASGVERRAVHAARAGGRDRRRLDRARRAARNRGAGRGGRGARRARADDVVPAGARPRAGSR